MADIQHPQWDLESVLSVLEVNRIAALEIAEERASRALLSFRRNHVFEKVFTKTLRELNAETSIGVLACAYYGEQFFDPYAHTPLEKLSEQKV